MEQCSSQCGFLAPRGLLSVDIPLEWFITRKYVLSREGIAGIFDLLNIIFNREEVSNSKRILAPRAVITKLK